MRAILFVCLFFHPVVCPAQDIYSLSFTTIDGQQHPMNAYKGKKILIVVLPGVISKSDTAFLKSLKTVPENYGGSLSVLAIPSMEDGYTPTALSRSEEYRKYIGYDVTITQGMYTRKNAVQQADLFKWLTDKDKNGHFDMDVEGAGQKFFVNESGTLYGVFGPPATLSPKLMKAAFLTRENISL